VTGHIQAYLAERIDRGHPVIRQVLRIGIEPVETDRTDTADPDDEQKQRAEAHSELGAYFQLVGESHNALDP
jgi:hypothetical protein